MPVPATLLRLVRSIVAAMSRSRALFVTGTSLDTASLPPVTPASDSLKTATSFGNDQPIAESTAVGRRLLGDTITDFCQAGTPAEALPMFVESWQATLITSYFTSGCPIAAGALAGGRRSVRPGCRGHRIRRLD